MIEDTENRERLAKLLRFYSSKSEEALTSLESYVSRMREGQSAIYYMAADSLQVARAAPFVEKLVAKGYEVLYLTDAIDEATITNLQKFQDKELVDVSKEGLTVRARGALTGEGATSAMESQGRWLTVLRVLRGGGRCALLAAAGQRGGQEEGRGAGQGVCRRGGLPQEGAGRARGKGGHLQQVRCGEQLRLPVCVRALGAGAWRATGALSLCAAHAAPCAG